MRSVAPLFLEAARAPLERMPPHYHHLRGLEGVFVLPFRAVKLMCLSTAGMGWEHVSITVRNRFEKQLARTPTWEEMAYVKEAFWDDDEAAVQVHPPRSEHVSYHDYCLHLWRPSDGVLPLPPSILVGPLGATRR